MYRPQPKPVCDDEHEIVWLYSAVSASSWERFVTGVTTEVCVHTTVREANDRGYECLVLEDCVGSYFPEFQRIGIEMIAAQGGIFGWVSDSPTFLAALREALGCR